MGILDDLLGGALGNVLGSAMGGGRQGPAAAGGGMGNVLAALLPVVLGMLANRQGGQQAGIGAGGTGGLGDVLGGLLGGSQATGSTGMGGLGQILEQFQRAGLGQQAASWVSTGQNMPVSPGAIGQVFDAETLSRIAREAGISEQEASTGLSQLLPEVVDRLTPSGQLPDLDQLSASVDAMRTRFGG